MSSFKLHSGDSAFNNRVDALFNSLQTVAVDLESQPPENFSGKRSLEDDDENDFDNGGTHSGTIGQKFRKPAGLPPKWRGRGGGANRAFGPRNSTPDYIKNPQNWTRYSMKDTKVSSDRENKQIGLELYQELRSRREDLESAETVEEEGCPKIVFKKPERLTEAIQDAGPPVKTDTSLDDHFGGSKKIRLPEYQVGKSKPKSELKVAEKEGNSTKKTKDAVRLDYLTFEDEDEDDDGN